MDFEKIVNYIKKYHMIQPRDVVIAAVSGGADSVALLLFLSEIAEKMEFTLYAVHVQHGIRGEESFADMRFTKELCDTLGIPVFVCHVDAPSYAAKNGTGLEEAARELRYQALDETVSALRREKEIPAGSVKIALAHHMQDQAETVLFRLARGSGMNGLSGMLPVRESGRGYFFIRPFLETSRSEIEAFLEERGQSCCVDSTNLDESYARNRIRARVLPELSLVNAQAAVHIARAAEQAAETEDYIAAEARRQFARIATVEDNGSRAGEGIRRISVKIPELLELHPAIQKELLRQALVLVSGREKDLTAFHITQLLELAGRTSGKEISLPYQVKALKEFDRLVLIRRPTDTPSVQPETDSGTEHEDRGNPTEIGENRLAGLKESGGVLAIPLGASEEIRLTVCRASETKELSKKESARKYYSYEKLKDGFSIRHRQPGDFFSMKNGHRKKLKQYLIDEKVPVSNRDDLWLLSRGSQIVWLIGGREDPSFRPDGHTEYVLSVEYRTRQTGVTGDREHNPGGK